MRKKREKMQELMSEIKDTKREIEEATQNNLRNKLELKAVSRRRKLNTAFKSVGRINTSTTNTLFKGSSHTEDRLNNSALNV